MKKVVIAGGSGFMGEALSHHFKSNGTEVFILTRKANYEKDGIHFINWDGTNLGDWSKHIDGSDLVINLAGKSVNCRYTEANKREIKRSRVDATKIIGEAISKASNPPKVWMNSSTATIFGYSLHEPQDEFSGRIGDDFSMGVARAWEDALNTSNTPNTRKIALRISLVLGKGSVLDVLAGQTKFGLGGYHGSGKQKFAWIHIDDVIQLIDYLYGKEDFSGPVNCVSPGIVTDREFMKNLRKTMKVPFGIPAPSPILKFGCFIIGTESELILKSRYVIPKRLLEAGYTFKYPNLDQALKDLLQKK
jgi:uncharacterized protein (TIGR01777 family)